MVRRLGVAATTVAVAVAVCVQVITSLQKPDAILGLLPPGHATVQSALVVTAHPDDESMFFLPSVVTLLDLGWRVHLLCLSTGKMI